MTRMRLVLPRCRQGLTPEDIAFLTQALHPVTGSGADIALLMSDPLIRDRLLDESSVRYHLLEQPDALNVSAALYFYVLTRRVLVEAGVDNCELADYLASLMVAKLQDRAPDLHVRHVPYVVDAALEIGESCGAERFFLIVQLADRLLFISGLYPAHLEQRRQRRGAPSMHYYDQVGGAHYRAASSHVLAKEYCLADIFESLSSAYVEVRAALNRIGERLAFLGSDGPMPRYLMN